MKYNSSLQSNKTLTAATSRKKSNFFEILTKVVMCKVLMTQCISNNTCIEMKDVWAMESKWYSEE